MRTEKRTFTVWSWERQGKSDVEIVHRPNSRRDVCRECGEVVEAGDGHLFSGGYGRAMCWHISCFLEKQSAKYPEVEESKPKATKPKSAKKVAPKAARTAKVEEPADLGSMIAKAVAEAMAALQPK